ncbi:FAS1 domain-containing protein [Thelonectria olida]|uniref:FAS1 domain-containing protein n=1 Tax=Thelonectria olida TaxID=1576542 RepID=A0A9P8VRK2_9HYPO|nr:FAS1 domain-containing protein [Thelonectria olida]
MKAPTYLYLALATVAAAQSNSRVSLADALAAKNKTLSALNGLLQSQSDLLDQLSDLSNITILAPSNEALGRFLNTTNITEVAVQDPNIVSAILSYHVLNGTYYASNFTDTPAFIPSLLNNQTYENVTGGQVVEGVAVDDGVSFYSALRAESNVTEANLNFTGGVIHIINRVLDIPMNLTQTAITANLTAAAGALTQANLISGLVNTQNITVFAPRNGAFGAIGSIFEDLSQDDLRNVLRYHVVSGTVGYSTLLENSTLKTVEGEDVTIAVYDGEVFVNEAKVVIPDVLIANGVVHVIDGVLNPENPSATADPDSETQAPAFSGATSASSVGVPFTSGVAEATEQATGLATSTSEEAGSRATAGVILGALFGGAALVANI